MKLSGKHVVFQDIGSYKSYKNLFGCLQLHEDNLFCAQKLILNKYTYVVVNSKEALSHVWHFLN